MASIVKWEAAPSVTADIMTTALNSLANNTISAVSTEVVNSTGLNTFFWLELNVTFGSAPSDANPSVDVYATRALDGTVYETAPLTGGADAGQTYIGSFPVQKVTSAQVLRIGPFGFEPLKHKFLLDNQTGVAFPASGSTLDIGVDNLEGQ